MLHGIPADMTHDVIIIETGDPSNYVTFIVCSLKWYKKSYINMIDLYLYLHASVLKNVERRFD